MTDSRDEQPLQPAEAAQTIGEPANTVLLVDESAKVREMVVDVLGNAGYLVITAADGFDALAKVVEHKPSLVLTDTLLSRLDGYQFCALMNNNADYRNIPVVLLSGATYPFDNSRARAAGISSHLSKPLTEQALLEVVRNKVPGQPVNSNASPD